MSMLELTPAADLSGIDPWGAIYSLGDTLARGRKGALITAALGASGLVPDQASFAGAYAGGKPEIDAWAEHISFAAAAREMGIGNTYLTPFVLGVAVGAGVAYLATR